MDQVQTSSWKLPVGCAVVLVSMTAGCAPSNSVQAGAPIMLSFGPVSAAAPYDAYGSPAYLPLATDAGPATVPPRSSFLAMFDRILDPTTLEDTDGGAKAGVAALTSDVVGAVTEVTTNYTPNGDPVNHVLVPQGPSIMVIPTCGMPSAAQMLLALDVAKLRSHDQTKTATLKDGVAATLAFATDPFSATTDVPAPAPATNDPSGPPLPAVVDPTLVVNLTFSNQTPPGLPDACQSVPPLPSIASHIHVAGTVSGVPVVPLAAVVTQDMADAGHWVVSPPGTTADGTPGAWPAGALITVTVDVGATDSFNKPLATEASASFLVKS